MMAFYTAMSTAHHLESSELRNRISTATTTPCANGQPLVLLDTLEKGGAVLQTREGDWVTHFAIVTMVST